MKGVFINGEIWTQRHMHTREMPFEDEGGNWGDESINHGTPAYHQKLGDLEQTAFIFSEGTV